MSAPLSLVTGATGFMGSHMVEELIAAGHRVRCTDLAFPEKDTHGRYTSLVRATGSELVEADLVSDNLDDLVKDVDYVFHVAGIFSYSAPKKVLDKINVGGTKNLIDAIKRRKGDPIKRLIVWGAGGVYGIPTGMGKIIRESDQYDPPNDYIQSKRDQEQVVMEAGAEWGLPFTVVRPTTAYGERSVYAGADLLLGMAKIPVVPLPVNFTGHVPMVYVRKVTGAALYLSDCPDAVGEAYNLNDDIQLTFVQLGQYIAATMDASFVTLPPIPIDMLRYVLTNIASASQKVLSLVNVRSPLEADSVSYLNVDFNFSTKKLADAGFVYKEDAYESIHRTLVWYASHGFLNRKPRPLIKNATTLLTAIPNHTIYWIYALLVVLLSCILYQVWS